MDIMDNINKGGEIAKIFIEFAEEIAKNPIFWIAIIWIGYLIYNNFIKNK